MDVLSHRPNILFLIWVRNKHILYLLNHKLYKPLYYRKLIDALTTIENGINIHGNFKKWVINGKTHRDDGPAWIQGISKEHPNGRYNGYFNNDKLHRNDGPASINGISQLDPNGRSHHYFEHGICHRDDGPAVIEGISVNNPNGTYRAYYKNGEYKK